MIRRGAGCVIAAVAAVVLVGCGGASNDVATATSRSTPVQPSEEVDESTSSMPSETMTTSSTAPPSPRPTPCGTSAGPDGEVVVTVVSGWGRCREALSLIATYHRDRPPADEEPTQALSIDGWECASDATAEPGPLVTCELPGYSVVTAGPEG